MASPARKAPRGTQARNRLSFFSSWPLYQKNLSPFQRPTLSAVGDWCLRLAHGGRCASGAEHESRRDATNRCTICAAGFPPGLEAAPPPSPSLWRTLRVSFRPDGHETGFRQSRKCTKKPHDATPLNLRTMSLVGSPCAFVLFNLASQVALCLFSRPAQPWVFVSFRVPREAPSKSQPLDRAAQRHSREPDRPEIWYNMRLLRTTA